MSQENNGPTYLYDVMETVDVVSLSLKNLIDNESTTL